MFSLGRTSASTKINPSHKLVGIDRHAVKFRFGQEIREENSSARN